MKLIGQSTACLLTLTALLSTNNQLLADAGDLAISPSEGLTASGFARGPFDQLEMAYTLQNNGIAPIIYFIVRNRSWVSISAAGGTLGVGESLGLTVRINSRALELPVTNDTATITFWNQTDVETDTRSVNLNVILPSPGTAAPESVVQAGLYEITLTGVNGSSYELQKAPAVTGGWSPFITDIFSGSTASHTITVDQGMEYYRAISSGPGAVPAQLSMAKVEALDNSLVRVSGDPDGVYVVESSSNMIDWIPVYTNKIPASGSYVFVNTMAGPEDDLAYRAVPTGALTLPVLNHVLIVGESLAVGFDGGPVLSTTAVGLNHRFTSVAGGSKSFLPLTELTFETIASGAANQTLELAPLHPIVMSNVGQAGASYQAQKKGTPVYEKGLLQFIDAPQALACELFGYAPRAIFVMAGGGDFANANYDTDIRQWQVDYEKDVQFFTGYAGSIPMFHSQFSAWSAAFYGGGRESAVSPYKVLAEAEQNPNKTVLVAPRYFLPHAVDGAQFPGIHPSNEGYRWLGEYYGKAYKQVVVDGGTWTPLKPSSVTRAGAVITATFDVPVAPLTFDTTLVTDPGDFGFEYYDDSENPPAIDSVAITGPNTVTVTLEAVPTGSDQRLRYAYTGIPGNNAGPTSGPRGNLRDSDSSISLSGRTLHNWCVHFDKPIN